MSVEPRYDVTEDQKGFTGGELEKGISFALHSSLVSSVSLDIHFLCHMFSFLPLYFHSSCHFYPHSFSVLREDLFCSILFSFIPLLQAT